MKIAFDVDGTLINFEDLPNYPVIDLLRWFSMHDWDVYIWSGGGQDYAMSWVNRLGLTNLIKGVIEKGSVEVDIAVDDENIPPEGVKAKVIINV